MRAARRWLEARRLGWLLLVLVLPVLLGGCDGIQSALMPEGQEAGRIAQIFWIMTAGGAVIFAGVIALTAMAMLRPERWRRLLGGQSAVVWGGIVFPVVTLSILLTYGLLVMRGGVPAEAGSDAVKIAVVGERWWWRVVYRDADGNSFESANELRIPVGQPIEIALTSADVIHSFWVPKLAGKLDMIPGRTNVQRLVAETPGLSRGQCAEYCGGAHAMMSFFVVAMEQEAFASWLAHESGPAEPPQTAVARRGQSLFLSNGCPACHTIRGTEASGTIGPDLTHVGSRTSLAAGTLPNDEESLARWIADSQHIKPENLMPPFGIFDDGELNALSSYLAGLR